jgi:peptidoglycan/LPS O-acetylase OafA/YrhL
MTRPDGGLTLRFATTDAAGRIPSLDGLRGVASLMVLTYHFGPHIAPEGTPFFFLHLIPPLFFQGVDLFFVLSGFLIGGILLDARESPAFFRTFYARRALRIFPLYYLTLALYFVGLAVAGPGATAWRLFENPIPPWAYWFYLQNVTMTVFNTFGPVWLAGSWSLAIEEQFYLILPAVVRFTSPRTLWRICWVAFLAALLLRGVIAKFKIVSSMGAYVLLPARMDSLAAGVMVAYALRYRGDAVERWRRWWPRLTVGIGLAWAIYPFVPNPQAIRMAFIEHGATALVFALLLLSLVIHPSGRLSRFLSLGWMRELGNLAYSTYLLHPILLGLTFRLWTGRDPMLESTSDLLVLAVAAAATFAVAVCSWRLFEKPLLRMGHRFRY